MKRITPFSNPEINLVNGITLNQLQEELQKTSDYPGKGTSLEYPGYALAEEAGEVAGQLKRLLKDKHLNKSKKQINKRKRKIADELGDVLWGVSEIAYELGYSLQDIATNNVQKHTKRANKRIKENVVYVSDSFEYCEGCGIFLTDIEKKDCHCGLCYDCCEEYFLNFLKKTCDKKCGYVKCNAKVRGENVTS